MDDLWDFWESTYSEWPLLCVCCLKAVPGPVTKGVWEALQGVEVIRREGRKREDLAVLKAANYLAYRLMWWR